MFVSFFCTFFFFFFSCVVILLSVDQIGRALGEEEEGEETTPQFRMDSRGGLCVYN